MPKPPPHLKIQRAKAFVDATGRMVLIECESCGQEKYVAEGQNRLRRMPLKAQTQIKILKVCDFGGISMLNQIWHLSSLGSLT